MSAGAPTLLGRWQDTLRREPGATALIEAAGGRVFTRAQLQAGAEAWLSGPAAGARLSRRRIGLAVPNGAAWLEVFIALQQVGAVPVLLDASEGGERLRAQAAELGASLLWSEGGLLPTSCPDSAVSRLRRAPRACPADHCLVKVTSGSTGSPKGLPFTHAQAAADGLQVCSSMGIRETDTNLALIPLGHSYGLGNLVLPLLLQGSPVLCGSMPLPHCIAADCARWRPSLFPAVPTLLRALLRSGLPGDALAPLRGVISAGAPLDPADAAAFVSRFSIRVHSFYGSSETGGISYDRSGEAAVTGRSVGAPMDGVSLRFGRGGRFHISGAAVMGRGSFSPADCAELTPEGELRLVGRVGRLFKIGGRRLDLAGLESEISSVLSARGVVVAAHPERPDCLAALVACDLGVTEARALLSRSLAAWKVPARVRVVQELPVTQRGKTDRRRAVELLAGAAAS